jgi:hypothetical protein
MAMAVLAPGPRRGSRGVAEEIRQMSPIDRVRTEDCRESDTETSRLEHYDSGLTLPIEDPEDFAELVRRLTKSTWFCEVAEA